MWSCSGQTFLFDWERIPWIAYSKIDADKFKRRTDRREIEITV